jgi:dihydroorotase
MISAMTVCPAGVIGVPKGTLKVGSDADITVFDPNLKVRLDKTKFRSKSQNTPFHGLQAQGKVCYTVVGGKVVYRSEHLGKEMA